MMHPRDADGATRKRRESRDSGIVFGDLLAAGRRFRKRGFTPAVNYPNRRADLRTLLEVSRVSLKRINLLPALPLRRGTVSRK